MRWVGFKALGCAAVLALASPVVASAAVACPTVEIAAVAPGGRAVRDLDDKGVLIGPAIVSLADITSAAPSKTDGVEGIGFNLRGPAGARLRAHTAANLGKPIAYVIDGRARVLTIRAPLSGDAFQITALPPGEGPLLAGRVNNCVTP